MVAWPTTGGSDGTWNDEMREWLDIEHNLDTGKHSDITADDIITKSPWADVRAYGAVGNGVTDDTTAIQAAIDAAEAVNGIVFIPTGTYKFTTGFTIESGITILGASQEGSVLKKSGNIVGITINSARGVAPSLSGHVVLKRFTLDSFGGGDASNGITITEFKAGIIDDVAVINQGSHGIEFKKGNSSSFSNLFLSSNGGDGFKVNASDANCNACVFTNIDTISNTGWGFNLDTGADNWLWGITSQNNGNGIRINTYGNVLYGYAESNTGQDIELTSAAKANVVHCIIPTEVTVDSYSFNTVHDRIGGQDFIVERGARFAGIPLSTLANDGTPTVVGRNILKTGGTTTITALDDGVEGQMVTIIGAHSTTQLTDGGTLKLAGNCILDIDDTIQLIFDGTNWHEISRTDVA